MGLDMFLTRELYVSNWGKSPQEGYDVRVTYAGKETTLQQPRITHVTEEIGYWRKSNQIHAWFVGNVQQGVDDCGDYYVSTEKLKQLKSICEEILADHDKAEELLATKGGFFFGSTDYDEYYFEDLSRTVQILTEAIKLSEEPNSSIYYHSSW